MDFANSLWKERGYEGKDVGFFGGLGVLRVFLDFYTGFVAAY
jgi:hypothetical protein